jgi:hypothetical protein
MVQLFIKRFLVVYFGMLAVLFIGLFITGIRAENGWISFWPLLITPLVACLVLVIHKLQDR